MIERYANENPIEFAPILDTLKKASTFRYKEYIRETLAEYSRRGNFIRIYPSKGSDMYDPFFLGPRTYNKAIYKALFTEEILRFNLNP